MNLCPQGGVGCLLFVWVDSGSKEYKGIEKESQRVYPLQYVNFTKVILRPIKRLKFMRSMFPGRSANFYCLLARVGELIVKKISHSK